MVRKWSYLNYSILQKPFIFNKSFKVKSFKVFKQTTKFKKFKRGVTHLVRQKYISRKFYTSDFTLLQITKWWSFNYIQSKQINRFYQSFSYSNILSNIPDYNILNFINYNHIKNANLHLFSCSKKIIFSLNNTTKSFSYNFQIKNSKISFVQTNNLTALSQSNIIYPLNLYFDNISYYPLLDNSNNINNLINSLCCYNLHFLLIYYQIFISCVLISSQSFQNSK